MRKASFSTNESGYLCFQHQRYLCTAGRSLTLDAAFALRPFVHGAAFLSATTSVCGHSGPMPPQRMHVQKTRHEVRAIGSFGLLHSGFHGTGRSCLFRSGVSNAPLQRLVLKVRDVDQQVDCSSEHKRMNSGTCLSTKVNRNQSIRKLRSRKSSCGRKRNGPPHSIPCRPDSIPGFFETTLESFRCMARVCSAMLT